MAHRYPCRPTIANQPRGPPAGGRSAFVTNVRVNLLVSGLVEETAIVVLVEQANDPGRAEPRM